MKKRTISSIISVILILSMSLQIIGCGKEAENSTIEISEVEETTDVSLETTETQIEEENKKAEEEKKAAEEAKKAEAEAKKAEEEAKKAEEEAKKAEEEAKRAEEERLKAEEEARKAEEEAKVEEERLKAEAEAKKAEEEAKKAEAEAKKAEEERLKAEAEAKKAEEERLKLEAEVKLAEEEALGLTPTQLLSITMLNYMTVFTQEVNNSKCDQLFLENARTTLYNDTVLNAVDRETQAQIIQLVGTIDQYCLVDVKRERIQFIYKQNRAQALRQAIPNPMGLLSAVQSGSLIKAIASVVYMAVDSASSYSAATNQAELQFIKEGWELDDEERKALQDSTTQQFSYMCDMVRKYDLPDEYVVRDTDVKAFVEWSNKSNLVQKTDWLKANEKKYQKFGPYWLELARDYYEANEYKSCMEAVSEYEAITAKITRQDLDYANVIPMVIISARETLKSDEYIETAEKYCEAILNNTKDDDWALRYFAAQIYLDIYAQNNDKEALKKAYDIAYYNVNTLIEEQQKLNSAYLAPINEVKPDKDATKRAKKEIKQYNKLIKEARDIEVPPVSEALYLNCDLLFALADKISISSSERERIEKLLHNKDEDLFLSKYIDDRFRLKPSGTVIASDNLDITFNGDEIIIPAACITERSKVSVNVNGNTSELFDDWVVSEVKRPKNTSYNEFVVTMKSQKADTYKYQVGDKISITVVPVIETPDEKLIFDYDVVATKKAFVINGMAFERK